jgi:hypothetical protein
LIGLLIVVAIIFLLAYPLFVKYLGKTSGMDKNTSVLDSAKSVINGVGQAQQENGYN